MADISVQQTNSVINIDTSILSKDSSNEQNVDPVKQIDPEHQMEFIMVFNTNGIINKLQRYIVSECVSQSNLLELTKRYDMYDEEFVKAYDKFKNFEKYHNMLYDTYKREYDRMKNVLIKNEIVVCTNYMYEMEDSICRCDKMRDIIEHIKVNCVDDINGEIDTLKSEIKDKIKLFTTQNNITEEGSKIINERLCKMFDGLEKQCEKFVQLNTEYSNKYDILVNDFCDAIEKTVGEFTFDTFGDQHNVIDSVDSKMRQTCESYLNMEIEYEDKYKPPVQLRMEYENKIRNEFEMKWEIVKQDIIANKYAELLDRLCHNNKTFIGVRTANNDEGFKCIDEENMIYIGVNILGELENIVTKSQTDIFYIGMVYMEKRKRNKKGHDKRVSYVATRDISYDYFGIYTEETIPKLFMHNKRIMDELFETSIVMCDIDGECEKHYIHIFSPKDRVIFSKFRSMLECLEYVDDIKKCYDIDITKIYE